jgi:predicted dinucleotide-binding enzyme
MHSEYTKQNTNPNRPFSTRIAVGLIIILCLLFLTFFSNHRDSSQHANATTVAVAQSLTAANASNAASRRLSITLGVPVRNCQDIAKALSKGLPDGYSIVDAGVPLDTSATCSLHGPYQTQATFLVTGVS